MSSKYGEINSSEIRAYLSRLRGRIFKILPSQEEGCKTLDSYIESLIREIVGAYEISGNLVFEKGELKLVVSTLKGVDLSSHNTLRSDVLKITNLIDRKLSGFDNYGS